MSEVLVRGAAMLPMGKYPQSSYGGLAVPPLLNACKSAGIDLKQIEAFYCGNSFGGMLAGQRIIREVGLGGIPVLNIENACSGGASAVNQAFKAIRAGEFDVVAVCGVDKLTQFGGGTLPLVAEDVEVQAGMVMPALYAMRARRHMYERGTTLEDLATISVKARSHGVLNPYAQFRKETNTAEVLASRMVADPLTLFQCCPTGDGAAVIIMMSAKAAKVHAGPAIRMLASTLHSGQVTAGYRNMLRPEITFECAHEAYEMAGCSAADLDMVELHDAFTIAELVYYEALGLCEVGQSTRLLRSGDTRLGGRIPVNPSGGLLSKGHPVGASGVAQMVEAYWQLTGQAERRQIENPRMALTHVTGGGIAGLDHGACTIHIFEKV